MAERMSRLQWTAIAAAALVAGALIADGLLDAPNVAATDWRAECAVPVSTMRTLDDAHIHVPRNADPDAFAAALLKDMNQAGIRRAVVRPDHTRDKRNAMQHLQQMDQTWADIAAECDRIVTLLYGFNPDDDAAFEYIEPQLRSGRFGGVGEIELLHPKMGIRHALDSPTMVRTLALLDQLGLAIHFQASHETDTALTDAIVAAARRHPNARFLWFGSHPSIGPATELTNLWFNAFAHPDLHLPEGAAAPRLVWGSDTTPRGFVSPSAGALPYDDVVEAAESARALLTAEQAAGMRHNFDEIWPR